MKSLRWSVYKMPEEELEIMNVACNKMWRFFEIRIMNNYIITYLYSLNLTYSSSQPKEPIYRSKIHLNLFYIH